MTNDDLAVEPMNWIAFTALVIFTLYIVMCCVLYAMQDRLLAHSSISAAMLRTCPAKISEFDAIFPDMAVYLVLYRG